MSNAKGEQCKHRSPSHNLLYSPNLPSHGDVYTAVVYCNTLVHLAKSYIPSALIYVAEIKDAGGRLLIDTAVICRALLLRCQVGAKQESGNGNSKIAQSVGPGVASDEPTKCGKGSEQTGLLITLCIQRGIHCTSHASRKTPALRTMTELNAAGDGGSGKGVAGNKSCPEKTNHSLGPGVAESACFPCL